MDEHFNGNSISYQYKNLIMICVVGGIRKRLSELVQIIGHRHPNIEIALVQYQPEHKRDFLATFIDNPPRDITIDQTETESAIVGFALEKEKLAWSMEGLAETLEFIPHLPDLHSALDWERSFRIEKAEYSHYESASRALKRPLNSLFGAIRYTHFLTQYKDIPDKEAMKLSIQKFGLPLSL